MGLQLPISSQNAGLMREIVMQTAKYSGSEVIITDERLNIIFHNDKYMENKTNLTLFDIADEFLNEDVRIKIDNFKNSQNSHLYMKLIFKNNKELENIPVDIHFCKIRNNKNRVKYYVIVIQDVLLEIRNRIQKETFIDIISHDLKNPMRANIGVLELILDNKFGYINKQLKSVLNELLNSCKFMKYMADNLIIKYKNEFDAYELNRKKTSIVKLIKERCCKISNIFDRKKQTVEMIINSKIPDVFIDSDEMKRVINNLLINASNESRENSKIIIQIKSDNENVYVSLLDNGFSQKNAILDNLFNEYISCANKFRKIGFSLEMFNCRKVIEAHGGTISAENISSVGKSITFSLPVC